MNIQGLHYLKHLSAIAVFSVLMVLCSCTRGESIPEKHISFIYSFDQKEMDRGVIPELIVSTIKKSGYNVTYDEFFLNCISLNEIDEINAISRHLQKLYQDGSTDLIVILNDQASYSAMKSRHKIFDKTPTVLLNVHFPNHSLLNQYKDKPLYCIASEPDYTKNIDFIDEIFNHNARIYIQYEVNALGERSFKYFEDQIKDRRVKIEFYYKNLLSQGETEASNQIEKMTYSTLSRRLMLKRHLGELQEKYSFESNDTTLVCIMPIRYMDGLFIFSSYEFLSHNFIKSADNDGYVLLLNNMDATENGLCRLWSIPIFSNFCEGFGHGAGVAGGYFASESSVARECCVTALKQFSSPGGLVLEERKFVRPEKGYYIDYNVIKDNEDITLSQIPTYAQIANLPYTVKNRMYIIIFGSFFGVVILALLFYFFQLYKRTKKEKKAVSKALEEMGMSVAISQSEAWRYESGVFYFNKTIFSLMNLPKTTLTVEEMRTQIYPDDVQAYDDMCRDLKNGKEKGAEKNRMMTLDGSICWFLVRYSKVASPSGRCQYVGISQNIQNVVDNENSLIQAKRLVEKAELKESFLANMSHEIRTPLNAIMGFSTLLCEDENNELGPEDKEYYKSRIDSNSKTLLGLIDDILNVSRIESGTMKFNFEEIEVGKMMDEVHSTHQILINPDLEFKYDKGFEDKVYIHVDKLRMIQVMSNFLTNANKFTKTGSITLGYALDRGKGFVHLYVADTGIGLSPEEQTVIFDRFYKNNEFIQGTGLGLSICKVIVEKLSGRIEVSSAKGKGSTFSVILPCRTGAC